MSKEIAVQRHQGDVLRVPVMTNSRTRPVRVYPLVLDGVRQAADGPVYAFRDHTGTVIHIREARLRWLQRRFERALQGA